MGGGLRHPIVLRNADTLQLGSKWPMPAEDEPSISRLLDAAQRDPTSAPNLLSQAYGHLRALAQSYLRAERPDHTLQATAVVHEAYLRLVGGGAVNWESPAQFFAAAAEMPAPKHPGMEYRPDSHW